MGVDAFREFAICTVKIRDTVRHINRIFPVFPAHFIGRGTGCFQTEPLEEKSLDRIPPSM